MRYMARFLHGETTEWANTMLYIVHMGMKKWVKGRTYHWWTVEEDLPLLPSIPAKKDSTVGHLVKAWHRFRKFLTLSNTSWSLTGSLTFMQGPAKDVTRQWRLLSTFCGRAHRRWRSGFSWETRAEETSASFRIPTILLDTIDIAISTSRKGSCLIHVLAATLQSIWNDRNQKVSHNKNVSTPLELILQAARHEAECTVTRTGPEESWLKGLATLRELSHLLNQTDPAMRSQQGSNQLFDNHDLGRLGDSLTTLALGNPIQLEESLLSGSTNQEKYFDGFNVL
ncbi:hypothetical protein R1sor_001424 [Riccia sorocarpa]|uniref:Uncharacterized protein n=1 Tax=Riccia sorocarpa TaxID=122646 RepID=A0ABD3GVY0_9MARC